jgi:uncharacterized protein (DUF1778 family)
MSIRRTTKRRHYMTTVRVDPATRELVYRAALKQGVTQSDFWRAAVQQAARAALEPTRHDGAS